ncbi:unnamed protein product [Miscanthus lutarioriparius]|uniref:DEAD-box RNA helicase Q domain-containing protein n=1 Tax=Miscanthus lutarioriparius TaxID=422564 RepID=A0A811QHK5_9POAL|nr:unnamed protein product [Miscanthus lutarioriparius]
MAMATTAAMGRCLLLSRSSPFRVRLLHAALSTAAPTLSPTSTPTPPPWNELLLKRLRICHLKDALSHGIPRPASRATEQSLQQGKGKRVEAAESFEELGLGEEVMAALGEMGISKPRAVVVAQALLVPAPPPSTVAAIARVDPSSSISSHKPSCALPLLPSASQAHEEAILLHLVANLS